MLHGITLTWINKLMENTIIGEGKKTTQLKNSNYWLLPILAQNSWGQCQIATKYRHHKKLDFLLLSLTRRKHHRNQHGSPNSFETLMLPKFCPWSACRKISELSKVTITILKKNTQMEMIFSVHDIFQREASKSYGHRHNAKHIVTSFHC